MQLCGCILYFYVIRFILCRDCETGDYNEIAESHCIMHNDNTVSIHTYVYSENKPFPINTVPPTSI